MGDRHREKSTVEEIRQRFDHDVERFSNAEVGQSSTMDAEPVLDMLTASLAAANPAAESILDIGCGAGNFTVRVLRRLPGLQCTLVDLSQPMLERAHDRVTEAGASSVTPRQGDIRDIELEPASYDIVIAAAVLHHLRSRAEWHALLQRLYGSQRPGGSFFYFDLIRHEHPAVDRLQWKRYAEYLKGLGGSSYQQRVFDYIEREDSPESPLFIMDALREAGYGVVDIVHKNGPFAAVAAFV
jgi:tRNA (cmo5U34)-methyltransferase